MNTITPIIFILVITVLAAEAWWLWFLYPHEQNISMPMFLFVELIILACLVLSFLSFAGRFAERFVFISPFIPLFLYFAIVRIFLIIERKSEEKKLNQEIKQIIKFSGISASGESFKKIGDIYFLRQDFEKALSWFEKAYSINESPEISHKINLAKREILLKQNKIWICPECSITNSSANKKCKSCGTVKPSIKTLKNEFHRNLVNLRKNVVFLIILAIIIPLFFWFIKNSSFLTSLIFFGILFVPFSFYIIYKIFSH